MNTLCALFLCVLLALTHGLYMDLYPGDLRCIGEELDQLEPVVFAMSASSAVRDAKQKVTVKVRDPDEEDLHFEKLPINNKMHEFEHKISQRGLYEMCFELYGGKTPVRVFFHTNYKPVDQDGQDTSRQVDKAQVSTLQEELRLIESKIKDIAVEIEHAKNQESFLNQANELTQSRLELFSYLSMAVLLGTVVWQILYLRSFFTSKKLL